MLIDRRVQDRMEEAEGRALSWVADRLDYFNPLRYDEILKLDLAIKASAELALLCDYAHSNGAQLEQKLYRKIASYIWYEIFSKTPVQDYLLTTELGLLSFGFYASLRQCGYEDRNYEQKLRSVLEDDYILVAERLPTRELDLVHSLSRLGFLVDGKRTKQVYSRSLLGNRPSLYPLTTDDAYAITHTIFFLTDFGRDHGCFSDADSRYFSAVLPRLTEFYLRKTNWDLVAELLIAMQATGVHSVSEYGEGWGLLLSAQAGNGSFPGPTPEQRGKSWAQGATDSGTGKTGATDAAWREFHDNYHTTLVTLLACQGVFRSTSKGMCSSSSRLMMRFASRGSKRPRVS